MEDPEEGPNLGNAAPTTDPVVPSKTQLLAVDGKLQDVDGTGGIGMVLYHRGKDHKALEGSLSVLLVRPLPL